MKVLANETKRILAVLLSVAMIFAYVPNNVMAYADDVSGDNIEEAATEAADGLEGTSGTEEGDVTNPELDAKDDVTVNFGNDTVWTGRGVDLYDLTEVENATSKSGKAFAGTPKTKKTDHNNAYTFIVEPKNGNKIKGTIVKGLAYRSYSSDADTTGTSQEMKTSGGNWTVEDYEGDLFNVGSKKVTITADALKTVYDAGRLVDGTVRGREVTVDFEATLTEPGELTVPIKCYDNTVKVKNVSTAEFTKKTNADGTFSLKDNIENFAGYSVLAGNFLSVVVKDKKGDVYATLTNDTVVSGVSGKILNIQNTNASTDDYVGVCTAANGYSTVAKVEDLKDYANYAWAAYVTGPDSNQKHGDTSTPAVKNGDIYISASALATIYSAGYTAELVLSAADNASIGSVNVTYADKDSKFAVYKKADASGDDAPASVTKNTALSVKVTPGTITGDTGNRQVDKVLYTVKDADETSANDSAKPVYTTATLNKDVSVRTVTSEDLTVIGDGKNNVKVLSVKGDELKQTADSDPKFRAEDGKKYSFIVIPKATYDVQAIQSNIGGKGLKYITPVDGLYTTEDVVNNGLEISVTTKASSGQTKNVVLATESSGTAAVKYALDGTTTIEKANPKGLAEVGRTFYFTVNEGGGKLNSVEYKYSTGNPVTLTPVANDGAGALWYAIPNVSDDITIIVNSSATAVLHNVYTTANAKAKITIDGKVQKPNTAIQAGEGKDLNFEVEAATGATIAEVGYYYNHNFNNTIDGTSTSYAAALVKEDVHKLGTTAGKYKITIPAASEFHSSDTTKAIGIYVLTKEAVPATDYRFNFKDSSNRVVSAYTREDKKNDIDFLAAQSLDMVLSKTKSNLSTTEVYLYNKTTRSYKATKLDLATSATQNPTLGFELTSASNVVTIDDKATKRVITANAKGSTTLKATFELDESAGNVLHRKVYTAELPVNVAGLYSDLAIATSTRSIYPSTGNVTVATDTEQVATLELKGKDSQTGKYGLITAGAAQDVTSIVWTFDPSIEGVPVEDRNHTFVPISGLKADRTYTIDDNSNKVYVVAEKVASEPFNAKATITYADGTKDEVISEDLRCVSKPDSEYFSVARISGAIVEDNYKNNETYNDGAANGNIVLGLAENDSKSINVEYDVYQILDKAKFNNAGGFTPGTTTAKDLEKPIEKGWIEKINGKEGVTLYGSKVEYWDSGLDESVNAGNYVELTGENGSYNLTAKKATKSGVKTNFIRLTPPTIAINGVVRKDLNPAGRTDDVRVRVEEKLSKTTVDLILYDSVEKTPGKPETAVVTAHKLSDAYIASRPYSEVESVLAANQEGKINSACTYGKITGGEFLSVEVGSSFVLPTAADLATSPSSNRVLVGWEKCNGITDGVGTWTGTTTSYANLGDSVKVDAGAAGTVNIYKAVWADRYGIAAVTNGNIVTTGKDDYDETKTINKYDTPITGSISVKGSLPVALKITEATGIDKTAAGTTIVAKNNLKGKTKYVTTGFTLSTESDAIKIGTDSSNRPTISGNKLSPTKKVTVKAAWNSDSGELTGESEGFNVVDNAPKLEIDLDKTVMSVQAGQDPTIPSSTVTTTLKVDGSPVTGLINGNVNTPKYGFTWSNASESDAAFVTAQTAFDKDNKTGDKLKSYVTGLQTTTEAVTLTLTASDMYGQTATKTLKVNVNTPDASIKLYSNNKAKGEIAGDKIAVLANSKLTDKASETNSFLVKAVDKDGKDVTNTGSWSLEVHKDADGNNNVLSTAANTQKISSTGTGYMSAQLTTENVVDEDILTVKYTYNGATYCKDVHVGTCYAVELQPPAFTSLEKTFITENGTKVVNDKGEPASAFIMLGADQIVRDEKGTGFKFNNISLAGYSAVYENTDENPDTQTFDHWTHDISNYTDSIATLTRGDFTGGIYILNPVTTPEITVTGIPATITLEHNTPTDEYNSWDLFDIEVEPFAYKGNSIVMKSSDVGFFKYGKGTDPVTPTLATGTDYITLTDNKPKSRKEGTLYLEKVGNTPKTWRAGKATLEFYANKDSSKVLWTATLYVDGLDYDAEHDVRSYYENGEKVKNAMRTVEDKVYYFDVSGNQITGSGVYTIEGKKVLIVAGNVAGKGKQVFENKEYFVEGNAGEIAVAKLVDVNGVQRYANSDGVLVTYEMATNGKYTDPVTGVTYVITQGTNAAVMDDILYNPTVKWTQDFPKTWKKSSGLPVVKYEITAISAKSGDKKETVKSGEITATVTADPATLSGNKITLSAEAILSGYFKDITGKTPATKDNTSNATTKREYTFKPGSDEGNSGGEASEDGEAESEPGKSEVVAYNSYNLFYTDTVIPVEGLVDAIGDSATLSGKAGQYFVPQGEGVKLKATDKASAKAAAKAANSLIVETGKDGEVFTYQLPVYYQKPTLKLTATKGTVKTGAFDKTTLHTTVTQKKSNTLFEPVAVDAEGDAAEIKFVASGSKPGLTLENGENDGDINITATGKTNGNLVVKKANWAEEVKLSYKVNESSKDVLEVSTTKVLMNTNAVNESPEAQVITVTLNGEPAAEGITVTPAKKFDSNIVLSEVSGGELTVSYGEAAPAKGSYKFTIAGGTAKKTITVKVSNKPLAKAVTLAVKSKMDVTTGQKMVVVPTLAEIGGPIEDVSIETVGNFGCTYNAMTNQIIVTSANPNLTAGTYSQKFQVTAGGVKFDVDLNNFKVVAKKPTVKISNVTFPSTLGTAVLEGSTNVLSTYKQGGKTFSTAPTAVTFKNGTEVKEGENAGYFLDSKTNAYVKYNAETGKIEIKAGSGSKAGTVNVSLTYAGQTKPINKTFKIKKAK